MPKARAKRKRKRNRGKVKERKRLLKEEEEKVRQYLLSQKNAEAPEVEVEALNQEMEVAMADVYNSVKARAELVVPNSGVITNEDFASTMDQLKSKLSSNINKKPLTKKQEQFRQDELQNAEDKIMSNRQKKLRRRLKIAELKQLVDRPDLVEEHDSNSADPRLLIFLKCQRNTIAVPEHWGRKRKYLQGKRGFEKPPFDLPSYIKNTGITAIRDEQLRIFSEKTRKQKQRAARGGAKGRMAISYQTLHDAFFVHMSKPPLTTFGDVYFEQKEREMKFRQFQPGRLSDRLKKALGMPATWKVIAPGGIPVYDDLEEETPREGQILANGTELAWDETSSDGNWIKIVRPVNGWIQVRDETNKLFAKQIQHNAPTTWLVAQQRFGPPPAYPDLKIPGLNAPIPPGHEYGYGDGQWGKPPITHDGRPLYGDPFGNYYEANFENDNSRLHWGDLQDISDDESSDEESSDEDEEEDEGISTGITSGITSGVTSGVGTGVESASSGAGTGTTSSQNDFNLRKKAGSETPESQKSLYQVLPQKELAQPSGTFAPSHVYDINKMDTEQEEIQGRQVDIALDPSELAEGNFDEARFKKQYEQALNAEEDGPQPKRRRTRFGRKDQDKDPYAVRF